MPHDTEANLNKNNVQTEHRPILGHFQSSARSFHETQATGQSPSLAEVASQGVKGDPVARLVVH